MQALSDYLSISSEDCFLCLNALYYKYQYLCHMAKYTVFHPCHHPGGDGIFVFANTGNKVSGISLSLLTFYIDLLPARKHSLCSGPQGPFIIKASDHLKMKGLVP